MRRYCSSQLQQGKPLAGASARGLGGFGQDLRSIWQPNSRLGRRSARACAEADFWETAALLNRTPSESLPYGALVGLSSVLVLALDGAMGAVRRVLQGFSDEQLPLPKEDFISLVQLCVIFG